MTDIEKKINDLQSEINELSWNYNKTRDHVKNHQDILFNDGKGLLWKLKLLEQSVKNKRSIFRTVLELIIAGAAIGGLIISLLK